MAQGKRYFEGQIWVDDRDLQIVKTYGKGVGVRHGDEQFPRFETYREQIDGKYWFPTYTRADDVLHFKDMNQRVTHDREVRELQEVRRQIDHQVRRRGGRQGQAVRPAGRRRRRRAESAEEIMPTKITPLNNGPLRIEGEFQIL